MCALGNDRIVLISSWNTYKRAVGILDSTYRAKKAIQAVGIGGGGTLIKHTTGIRELASHRGKSAHDAESNIDNLGYSKQLSI